MKIFIIGYAAKVTDNYHCGGGLVVIAEDLDHAKQVVGGDKSIDLDEDEWASAEVLELAGEAEPRYIVFPDAGCC